MSNFCGFQNVLAIVVKMLLTIVCYRVVINSNCLNNDAINFIDTPTIVPEILQEKPNIQNVRTVIFSAAFEHTSHICVYIPVASRDPSKLECSYRL